MLPERLVRSVRALETVLEVWLGTAMRAHLCLKVRARDMPIGRPKTPLPTVQTDVWGVLYSFSPNAF
jgi:hypothetical protein